MFIERTSDNAVFRYEKQMRIHSSAKGRIATIDHLVHVFDYGSTWTEDINHFFVVVSKNSLKDIHMNIIEEMNGKKDPAPQD